ncbi:hypothetical protein Q7P37_004016 [Cladosporium fusiforme]
MSFSLSSLLNPSSANNADTQEQDQDQQQHTSPTDQRKDSLPSIPQLQSPEQHHVNLPQYSPPPSSHQRSSPPQSQDAVQALTSLSASNAPPPSQWNGHAASAVGRQTRRESVDRRPSSSHNVSIELPPPPPADAQRKMSSPTLDQYHVASRSPEQKRPSLAVPGDAAFTLPPLQHVTSTGEDQKRRPSAMSDQQLSPGSTRVPQESSGILSQAEYGNNLDPAEQTTSQAAVGSALEPSTATKEDAGDLSPAHIKQESHTTTQPTSPVDARRPSLQVNDMEPSTSKAVNSLKRENSTRHQSPLRESSVPMPSTEDVFAESTVPKKRPLPKKKGTATTTKKAPPAKKRKVESTRGDTPSSRMSRPTGKSGSSKGTPLNSSPAPSNRSGSVDPDEEESEEEEGTPVSDDLYCLCKRPDTGTFMIGCDGTCDDWFHGKCVGIEERDKHLIDKYMCPRCTEAGVGRTTWKRMCRRSGCRQPARMGKNKTGNGSKYCSDECGVAFFRQMTANSRGREHAAKNRHTRQRAGHQLPSDSQPSAEHGARGGVLAPPEIRALLDSTSSLDEFKKLGDGVLSPPATPNGKGGEGAAEGHKGDYTEPETQSLAEIAAKKDDSRVRHQLLKDRLKFINMVKQAASRSCTEKELKPKDYCGFDPRLEWSEEQFGMWRNSSVGKQAFELETLATESSDGMVVDDDDDDDNIHVAVRMCDKKKCARHLDWAKLATDDVRFEMGDNGDQMRSLDREEREIRERAAMRARAGGGLQGEGSIEVHGLGIEDGSGGVEDVAKGQEPAVPSLPAPESVVPAIPPSEVMQVDTTA